MSKTTSIDMLREALAQFALISGAPERGGERKKLLELRQALSDIHALVDERLYELEHRPFSGYKD